MSREGEGTCNQKARLFALKGEFLVYFELHLSLKFVLKYDCEQNILFVLDLIAYLKEATSWNQFCAE